MTERDPVWNALKEFSRRKLNENRAKMLATALSEDDGKWVRHTEYHWSRNLNGERLDYWPSRKKYQFRGKLCVVTLNNLLQSWRNHEKEILP